MLLMLQLKTLSGELTTTHILGREVVVEEAVGYLVVDVVDVAVEDVVWGADDDSDPGAGGKGEPH